MALFAKTVHTSLSASYILFAYNLWPSTYAREATMQTLLYSVSGFFWSASSLAICIRVM